MKVLSGFSGHGSGLSKSHEPLYYICPFLVPHCGGDGEGQHTKQIDYFFFVHEGPPVMFVYLAIAILSRAGSSSSLPLYVARLCPGVVFSSTITHNKGSTYA